MYAYGTDRDDIIDIHLSQSSPTASWPSFQPWWYVYAKAGDDIVYGSFTNDSIEGQDGNDILYGFAGNDQIFGGNGDDIIFGGVGSDALRGGNGYNELYVESGADYIEGGSQYDILNGGSENDSLLAGNGPDELYGGSGNDSLFGESGSDVLRGESGNDRLFGQDGNDFYYFDGYSIDRINEGVYVTLAPRKERTLDNNDRIYFNARTIDIAGKRPAGTNDLFLYTLKDAADGRIDTGIYIENYYSGGHYIVEYLIPRDGKALYLPSLFHV